jgi:hypothetical protein
VPPLFRRRPLVRAEVALHGPRRAAVMLHPAPGRWPEHEAGDRLELGVGAVAVAARRAPAPRWPPTQSVLVALASGLAAADRGALPGDLVQLDPLGPVGPLAVVPWEGEGRARVDFDLVGSVAGTVPGLPVEPVEAGPAVEIAAVALVVALAADDPATRLPLALGIEGVLSWMRESYRAAPARDALRFALAHADGRLREAGRSLPR